MASMTFHDFCGGEFWNETLLLDNTWPKFTECFMNTIIVWVPCAYLFLLTPYYVISWSSQKKGVNAFPITAVNSVKFFCCITLAILSLVRLLRRLDSDVIIRSGAAYLGDVLHFLAYTLLAVMVQHERLKGVQRSALQFFFWLLTSMFNVIPFYTVIIEQLYSRDLVSFVIFTVSYLLQLISLFLTSVVDHADQSEYRSMDQKPCPETTCSYPSYISFCWISRLLTTGYKRELVESDLWTLPEKDQSNVVMPKFNRLWEEEYHKCDRINRKRLESSVRFSPSQKNGAVKESTLKTFLIHETTVNDEKEGVKRERPSLFRVLAKIHFKDFAICFVLKIASDISLLCGPLILRELLTVLSEKRAGREWQAYFLCAAMFFTIVIKSVFSNHCMFGASRIGLRIKSSLIAAVYDKALKINNVAKNRSATGEIINLVSVDTEKILDMCANVYYLMTAPLQLVVGAALLYFAFGVAAFAGVLVLLLMIVLGYLLAAWERRIQNSNLKYKGRRIRIFNEILNGIKVLKLYAWEQSFEAKVRDIRKQEEALLFKMAVEIGLKSVIWQYASYLIMLVILVAYVLGDPSNVLDANKLFTSMSVLNIFRGLMIFTSRVILLIVQSQLAIKRIGDFLTATDDLDPAAVTWDNSASHVITIQNASFTWDGDIQPALKNINLEVKEGQLVAVVGPVGCGKSSLISAICGEMEKISGTVTCKGSLAYVPQQAWLQNATLRDNILFGEPFNHDKYQKTLETCQLERDLTLLPAEDLTEIGEKGINLSGGQKQRVSLARAMYSDADVYLLDDPLSAVDSHVGKAIFNKVIGPNGVLKKKTRLFVTHGIHWLPMVDEIIVMTDGSISERGSYEELVSHEGPFAKFLQTYLTECLENEDEIDPEVVEMQHKVFQRLHSLSTDGNSSGDELHILGSRQKRKRKQRTGKEKKAEVIALSEIKQSMVQDQTSDSGRLISEERVAVGKVKSQLLKEYCQAAGVLALMLASFLFWAFQAFSGGANFLLKDWASEVELLNASTTDLAALKQRNTFYLAIYGVLGIVQGPFLYGYSYVLHSRLVSAACRFHARLIDRLLHAPMAFFDTTPMGRILNRVSSDINILDDTLPLIIQSSVMCVGALVLTFVIIMIEAPSTGVALVPAVLLYCVCQNFYNRTACQLKRLELSARSPIYSFFSETISGAASIRAYGVRQRFVEQSKARVDRSHAYYLAIQAATWWLQFHVEVLGAIVTLATAIASVLQAGADPGAAGLSLSYALQISTMLAFLTRQISEVETNIVAIERLKEYSQIDTESDWIIPQSRPPPTWPEAGEIIFDNYQTRYREGLDLALKGLTCVIWPGEKVAVVGRTGAGKSSLALSLFRLIEAAGGSIIIDGVNIAHIGLHDLRSRLTVLPQDPVVFSGTLRMNLDPFDEYKDNQLWMALERAHLQQTVAALPGQLSYQCGEDGSSLSVGERQLLCLARTLLRKTQILILDEATAAVDMETDALIQSTIRTAFKSCTILAIAHRLSTIIDYDRIMVMADGKIAEFATPEVLLQNKRSIFYGMARNAGLV